MNASLLMKSAVAGMVLISSLAIADGMPKKMNGILVNDAGMTLYTFDKDGKDQSNCYDQCAMNWPPVMMGAWKVYDPYSVVIRKDGSKQIAYEGKPMYLFVGDSKPGDRTGDNMKGVWHVISEGY